MSTNNLNADLAEQITIDLAVLPTKRAYRIYQKINDDKIELLSVIRTGHHQRDQENLFEMLTTLEQQSAFF